MLSYFATLALLVADGGAADAGAPAWWAPRRAAPSAPAPAPKPPPGSFQTYDGQNRFDGGFTDELTLEVGGCAFVAFPRRVVSIVCDAPIVRLEAEETAFKFVAVEEGSTACGFWFSGKEPPGRYIRIVVTKATAKPNDVGTCLWPSARPAEGE